MATRKPVPRKPEPMIVSEVCTICGLDWKRHGTEPTTETCISLLQADVRALNAQLAARPLWPIANPVYPPPFYPRPFVSTPWYGTTGTNTTGSATWSEGGGGTVITPRAPNTHPKPGI